MYGIRDPRSRLDQNPAERGQPLEATGWETKRRLRLFLSSSRHRPRSERACRQTTAIPFFSELERCHLIHGKRGKLSLRVEALKEKDRETRRHRNHGNPGGRKTMYGIRDPRSRLDQNPAERGQPLEATGWETKRRLRLFLSSSRHKKRD
uniref:Uncharacterized protein n=1 Tax=Oryza brachyantha TaxID=4533 RepID=J3LQ98_ORYBR